MWSRKRTDAPQVWTCVELSCLACVLFWGFPSLAGPKRQSQAQMPSKMAKRQRKSSNWAPNPPKLQRVLLSIPSNLETQGGRTTPPLTSESPAWPAKLPNPNGETPVEPEWPQAACVASSAATRATQAFAHPTILMVGLPLNTSAGVMVVNQCDGGLTLWARSSSHKLAMDAADRARPETVLGALGDVRAGGLAEAIALLADPHTDAALRLTSVAVATTGATTGGMDKAQLSTCAACPEALREARASAKLAPAASGSITGSSQSASSSSPSSPLPASTPELSSSPSHAPSNAFIPDLLSKPRCAFFRLTSASKALATSTWP